MYFMQTPGWPGQTAKEQGLAPRRERPCPKCHQDPITGNKSLRLQIQRAQISSCMHTSFSIWVDISSLREIFFRDYFLLSFLECCLSKCRWKEFHHQKSPTECCERNFNGGNEKIHIILSASLFALLITFHNGSPHL